ncbi:MAG: PA14 domain-containing protein [Lentisphaeraceae bacterium]|nr:PA14 domain-containing protein [Lentisphaeraceae bacterium]
MTIKLNEITERKIAEFGKRRRKLIIQKGLFTFIAASLVAFSLLATLDYMFFMEDWLRLTLSAITYTGLLIHLYISSLSKLLDKVDQKDLAKIFEAANPEMREKLLAAVELSDGDSEKFGNSKAFNEVIQKNVSGELSTVDINDILPRTLIAKRFKTALLVMAACFALMFIPGFKFAKLLMRAVVPVANIERVSNIKIDIIEPSPAEGVIPRGDAVSFVIQVSDVDLKEAWFEYRNNGDKASKISMQKIGDDRFQTSINIGRDNIRYRFRAGTAQTRFYTLESVPRPQIIEFEKTYQFPKYSLLPTKSIKEQNGNIKALEETIVDLSMTADQDISQAEIHLNDPSGDVKVIPLKVTDGKTLKGSLRVESSATYKVHITASKSEFENKFSPQYEILALADVLPSVTLNQPNKDLIMAKNDILQIKGLASDDLGIKQSFLEYKINLDEWIKVPLLKGPSKEMTILHKWDLSELEIDAGDELTFRLMAKDLKGNPGVSSSIRLSIVADGFNPKRFDRLTLFRSVQTSLEKTSSKADFTKKTFDQLFHTLVNEADKNKQMQAAIQLENELDDLTAIVEKQIDNIAQQTSRAFETRDADDLVLTGNVISHLLHDKLKKALNNLEIDFDTDRNTRNHFYHTSRHSLNEFHHNIKRVNQFFDRLYAQSGTEIAYDDIKQIYAEQQSIESNQTQTEIENTKRRQQNLVKTFETEKKLFEEIKIVADGGIHHRLNNLQNSYKYINEETSKLLLQGPRETPGKFLIEYFADSKHQLKRFEKYEDKIKINVKNSPGHGIADDFWSARISGKIRAQEEGQHEFSLRGNGHVKLWLDGQLVIDHQYNKKVKELKHKINLAFNQEVDIKLHFVDVQKNSNLSLMWQSKKGKKQYQAASQQAYEFKNILNRMKSTAHEGFHMRKDAAYHGEIARKELRRFLQKQSEMIKQAAQAMKELAKAEKNKDEKRAENEKKKAEELLEKAKAELETKAALEEQKAEADSQFVEDAAKTAKAIAKIQQDFMQSKEDAAEKLEKLAKAFDDLEKAHELNEIQEKLDQAKEDEKEIQKGEDIAKATEWRETEEQIKELVNELNKGDAEDRQQAADLNKALYNQESNEVRQEMEHRRNNPQARKDLEAQLEKLSEALAKAEKKQAESVDEARQVLDETAPTLGEQLAELSDMAKEQQNQTSELAQKADEENVEATQDAAKELQKNQEALNDKLEEMRQALKREANAQDLSEMEGIQKARDADDALAMLSQPPPKAEELLAEASNAETVEEQKEALTQTEKQQEKISKALEQLEKHYNAEMSEEQLAESREQLRESEKQAQFNPQMAQQYEQAEALAEISEQEIHEQIKALENILSNDEEMQKALADIAEQNSEAASQKLMEAASNEGKINAELAKSGKNEKSQQKAMDKQTKQQEQNTAATQQAAEDLARSQRHQERLGDNNATEQAQQATESAQQAAQQMQQAEQQLENQGNFQQAQDSVSQAQQAAEKAAAQAAQSSQQNQQAQDQPASSPQQQTSQQLAQALDLLDQAKNSMAQAQQGQAEQPQSSTNAQAAQSQAQQALQMAQQALAQAQQAQAQQMAQSRSQNTPQSTESGQTQAQLASADISEISEKLKNSGEWGKLPKRVARDLRNAKKEKVPEQYQKMVNAYFKIIAEQSQKGAGK